MENIQIIGMENLDDSEKKILSKLTKEYYPKIARRLKNKIVLVLHIKLVSKGGKRRRFNVTLRVVAPTHTFESSIEEWDLSTVIHIAFEELESEIEHRFKD
jgi:hypothetical protein